MYWTCGQCCVFRIWVVGSKIAIGLYVLDMSISAVCSICGWLGSSIVTGLYTLDMWSVLYVMYESDVIKCNDFNEHTGHVVSVVCSGYGMWDLI